MFSYHRLSVALFITALVSALVFAAAIHQLSKAQETLSHTHELKYQSYLLADELRQSSDDLTRLARTYVVTGEAAYESQYQRVLDIRNGVAGRPEKYNEMYWDFQIAGKTPMADPNTGEKIPLIDLIKSLGATEEELAQLEASRNNSDALVAAEVKAMNAIKGLYQADDGQYTREGPADFVLARDLMHSIDYHREKAKIMQPIGVYYELVQNRFEKALGDASNNHTLWSGITILSAIATILSSLFGAWTLRSCTGALRRARDFARDIGDGQLETAITFKDRHEVGQLLSALNNMQSTIRQNQRALNEESQALSNRLEQGLEHASACLLMTDAELRITYANRAFKSLFAGSLNGAKDTYLGQHINELGIHYALDGQTSLSALVEQGGGEAVCDQRQLRVGCQALENQGTPMGWVINFADHSAESALIQAVQDMVNAALKGDLSGRVRLPENESFVSTLGEAMNTLIDVADKITRDLLLLLQALAQGNLSQSIENDYQGRFGDLCHHANLTVSKIKSVTGEITEVSNVVNIGVDNIFTGSTELQEHVTLLNEEIQHAQHKLKEMTGIAKNNADNALKARDHSGHALDASNRGNQIIKDAEAAMLLIDEASREIGDVTSLINGIASQTNLLALNASVEAARAGEHGKGFAVVASEVRELSLRTTDAANKIEGLVRDSGKKVTDGVQLFSQSAEALGSIKDSIERVSTLIQEISAGIDNQSDNIDIINRAMGELASSNERNAINVESSVAAGNQLSSQSKRLQDLSSFFSH